MSEQLSLFDVAEEALSQPYEARPESQHSDYPKYVLYRGQMHRVLYYEGDGMFRLLDKGDRQMSVHRDRVQFVRPKKA